MFENRLSLEERDLLLKLARQALESAARDKPLSTINIEHYSQNLQAEGATFVTLTKKGKLRGCIGALVAYRPLVEDVREHAVAAATEDYRFPRVDPSEISEISIEISRLTKPEPLAYENQDDLLKKLIPNVHGVVLRDGYRRATFLPQVWEKIPNPSNFLTQLCIKMGNRPDAWRSKKMEVLIYMVEEFHE